MADAIALVRRRPGFRNLWLGNLISQLGDWVGWVAVAVLALHAGGGPLDVAIVFAAHHLPAAVVTPISGALSDRHDRRRVLVAVSLVLAGLTVGMAVAAAMTALGALQALLVARSAMTAFFTPAERAALPRVVEREELLLAGTIDAGSWSVVFSVGMALGGFLSALGPVVALSIDAVTFVVSALLFARLPPLPPAIDRAGKRRTSVLVELAEAIRYLAPRRPLRRAVLAKTPLALAGGAAWLVLALRADALLGAAIGFGLLNAIRGIGTGVGPALVTWALRRGIARAPVWKAIYATGLLGMLAFAAAPNAALAIIAVVLWGIGSGGNWVLSSERIAALGPDRLMGRLTALDHIGMTAAMTAGTLLAALCW